WPNRSCAAKPIDSRQGIHRHPLGLATMRTFPRQHRRSRSGVALALAVVSLVTLLTFVALAIDLGMLATASTQCQDAADSAAMAGARTLNGDTSNNNNYSNVQPNAQAAATGNTVLSKQIQTSQLGLQIGRYTYNTSSQSFQGQFP